MNDMFYFIEKCTLYNYADDNSLGSFAPKVDDVLDCLKHDSEIAIQWFMENGMQAHPDKFYFMLLSPQNIGPTSITLSENVTIESEPFVKALGVIIDKNLNFTDQVSV